jgi:hypothetical protein
MWSVPKDDNLEHKLTSPKIFAKNQRYQAHRMENNLDVYTISFDCFDIWHWQIFPPNINTQFTLKCVQALIHCSYATNYTLNLKVIKPTDYSLHIHHYCQHFTSAFTDSQFTHNAPWFASSCTHSKIQHSLLNNPFYSSNHVLCIPHTYLFGEVTNERFTHVSPSLPNIIVQNNNNSTTYSLLKQLCDDRRCLAHNSRCHCGTDNTTLARCLYGWSLL